MNFVCYHHDAVCTKQENVCSLTCEMYKMNTFLDSLWMYFSLSTSVSESDSTSCQWVVPTPSWSEDHFPPVSGRLHLSSTNESLSSHRLALSSPDESTNPLAFAPRQHGGMGLPAMAYPHSMSHEGLGVTGQPYTNSLLNLLHSDRSEVAAGVASGSKPELLPSWMGQPAFRDPMNPDSGMAASTQILYHYACAGRGRLLSFT